jgi:tetratricopeptide (TPR) repeat protein
MLALALALALAGAQAPASAQGQPTPLSPTPARPPTPPEPTPPMEPGPPAAAAEPGAPADAELPLTGPAFKLADEAYVAMDRRDYRTAVTKLEEAIRQRPDSGQLKVLLVNALEQSGNPQEAERRAAQYIAEGANYPALVAERDRLQRRLRDAAVARAQLEVLKSPDNSAARERLVRLMNSPEAPPPNPAYVAADAAYKAMARKQYDIAATRAAAAVRLQPGNRAYRLLLVNALAAAGKRTEAEAAATEALARDPGDWAMLAQRAQIRFQLDRPAEAADDDEAALRAGVPEARVRDLRLALADAAAKAGQPQRVLDALAPYAGETSYAIATRRGYAFLALGRKDEALGCFDTAIAAASPGHDKDVATAAKIGLLADLGRTKEAAELYRQALARGELATVPDLDVAYLGVRVGDDAAADQRFAKAKDEGTLTPAAALDAAYTARRLGRNQESLAYFRMAIDAANAGTLPMTKQQLFDVRRGVSEMERRWGAYGSLFYNAVGVAPAALNAPTPPEGNVLQAGFEAYYRPPVIGYRDGRIFEVFVRQFDILTNGTGGPAGFSTAQGVAGMRYKPLSDVNLVLETAGLFALGVYGRNDWMLRAYASQGQGTDLRVEDPSWWTWQVYGDYAHFFVTPQNLMAFEARAGRSFRLDRLSDHLVATPFAAIGGAYDDSLATPGALGIGPGLGLRYWFREDTYAAPRSFVDMNVQYRFKIAGDDRANGIYAGMTIAY